MYLKKYILTAVVLGAVFLTGCKTFNADKEVFDRYYLTTLKLSQSADILRVIRRGETELISQSDSVLAAWGQNKKGSILWFNMVTFDEEQLTAAGKYSFAVNERAKGYFVVPMQRIRFDAQIVIDEDTLSRPYARRNEKRIAVLKKIIEHFKKDSSQLTFDSRTLESAVMMVNQTLSTILVKLDSSPALAAKLPELSGMNFDHMTLGPGRVRMIIENDIVKIKVKIGKDWFNRQRFEHHADVVNM